MFIYGQDIPLDDVPGGETGDSSERQQVEPAEYLFEYGRDIFPDATAD